MDGKIFNWLAGWIGETAAKFIFSFVRIFSVTFLTLVIIGLVEIDFNLPIKLDAIIAIIVGAVPQALKKVLPWLAVFLEEAKKKGA